jgi:hypothetical protein
MPSFSSKAIIKHERIKDNVKEQAFIFKIRVIKSIPQ